LQSCQEEIAVVESFVRERGLRRSRVDERRSQVVTFKFKPFSNIELIRRHRTASCQRASVWGQRRYDGVQRRIDSVLVSSPALWYRRLSGGNLFTALRRQWILPRPPTESVASSCWALHRETVSRAQSLGRV